MFGLAGCDGLGEKYWLDTQAVASEVFGGEEFNAIYNIDFSDNLDTISAQTYGTDYAELKNVLAPLFTFSVSYAYNHYNDLLITPKNNNDELKKQISAVNNNLQAFSNALKDFAEKKTHYESYIDFTDEASAKSDSEQARLLLFKREYISVIEKAYNLSESVFNARKVGYYNFSDYSDQSVELADINADCSLALNLSNLEITKCAIKIVRAYNAKEVASNYMNYTQQASSYYNGVVLLFEQKLLTPGENAQQNLAKWQDVNEMFKKEITRFTQNLSKINLELLTECNNDVNLYVNQTKKAQDAVYVEYYLNFYNNIEILHQYSLNIFS